MPPRLPASVDLRELLPPVMDQNELGSSVAHAMAAAVSLQQAVEDATDGVADLESDIEEANRRIVSEESLHEQALQELDATILRDLEAIAEAEPQASSPFPSSNIRVANLRELPRVSVRNPRELPRVSVCNLGRLELDRHAREMVSVEPIREVGHELPVDYTPGRTEGSMRLERVTFDPIAFERAMREHRPSSDPGTFNREALRALRDEIERRPLRVGALSIPHFQAPLQISRLTPQSLPLQSDVDQHNAESIRAAEDEEVFRRLDEVAADIESGRAIVTNIQHEYPPGGPVEVENVPLEVARFRESHQLGRLRGHPEHSVMVDTDSGWGRPNANGDLYHVDPRQGLRVLGPDVQHESRPALGWAIQEEPGSGVINPNVMRGQRVTVPEFEIASNPQVQISDIKMRRFDLLERNFEVGDWIVLRIDEEHPCQIMKIEGDILFVQGFDYIAFVLTGLISPVPKQDVRRVPVPVPDIWHRLLRDDDLI